MSYYNLIILLNSIYLKLSLVKKQKLTLINDGHRGDYYCFYYHFQTLQVFKRYYFLSSIIYLLFIIFYLLFNKNFEFRKSF